MNDQTSKLVSIITITFNSESSVSETIESVLSQGIDDLEYLIIDGGSSDATLDIARAFNDPRIIIISEPDKGISDAMNKGLRRSTGRFVGIIHSDDAYTPGALKWAIECLQPKAGPAWCYGILQYTNRSGQNVFRSGRPFCQRKMNTYMATPHPTVFINRALLDQLGLFDESRKLAMDYDFCLRASQIAKPEFIDRTLAVMRLGGASSKNCENELKAAREVFEIKCKHLPNGRILHWIYWLWMSSKTVLRYRLLKIQGFEALIFWFKRTLHKANLR